MKQFLLRICKAFLLVFFPGLLFAQNNPDYKVLLNSGNITPPENSKIITKDSEVFRKSQFGQLHYVVLQFNALPNQAAKEKLKAAGITLIDYIPNLAYTARIRQWTNIPGLQNLGVRSIFNLSAAQKTVPAFLENQFPAHAVKQQDFVDVTVITFEKLAATSISQELRKLNITILEDLPMFRSFTLRVPQKNIRQLFNLPFIQWVEPIDAPNQLENLLGRTLHRVNVLNDGVRNLKGDSINIGIWDGGEVSPHLDFSPVSSRLNIMETSQDDSHATHVAGTIGGRGIINPKARGMAPNAKLYSYNFSGNITAELAAAIPAQNLAVSSHSYGSTQTCGVTGAGVAYSSTSRNTDINLNTHKSHLHIHSSGNSQSACTGGWSTITGSGKTAKNNIVVANITTTETISGSSSFGPVRDGRVKPEISSFGTNVLSTYLPLNAYGTISGTSMATPGVSGTVALLVQRYKQLHKTLPPSALIKAAICNTAHDLGNAGPDYKFGFGRLNALSAVRALEQNRYLLNTITTGATSDKVITIPPGTARLKIMLTWNDPAATSNANVSLVNNLDLSVISTSGTTLPWVLDASNPAGLATRGIDNVSNIEQVTIDNPTAGTYTLRVNGTAIPSGADQEYALTWEIDQPYMEVIFPNGNESLTPGVPETITWNNAGITGNQTIQYSLNNGATWVTLSTSVPAATTRYSWSVPSSANTSTALVRISSGSVSDISDATFRILRAPVNLNTAASLCSGTLNFVWSPVTNATHYDLLYFNAASGDWDTLSTNISGTSYFATGLTPNATMWFSLRAKNLLTGAISERGLGINRTVPATGTAALGQISGPAALCSGSQNITYSVSSVTGATTYNWTLPTGVTLVSGQGSNTIIVNIASTNLSGNIAVTAGNGSCQLPSRTLAVVASQKISALPMHNAGCTGTQVTLGASGAPSGGSYRWYIAATGGTPISGATGNTYQTPALSASATYYVTAVTVQGCEGPRVPVTATINQAPVVNAGSGQTLCTNALPVTLIGFAPAGGTWSGNGVNGTGQFDPAIAGPGSHTLRYTVSANGCDGSASVIMVVYPAPATPVVNVLPNDQLEASLSGMSYDWRKDGVLLPFTTQTITAASTGIYTVKVTDANSCASPESVSLTYTVTSLADEFLAAAGLIVFPNPATGTVSVLLKNAKAKTQVRIVDLTGKEVFADELIFDGKAASKTIHLTGVAKGMYLIRVGNLTKKLMVN